ncbi:hypothetical protein ACP70R_021240 [Stipagrostis hirtigluma subsp. patula]
MELISSTTLLFLFLISLPILVSSLRHQSGAKSKRRRPPGPWGFPFVGSLHHLLTSQPQAALRDLADKHGPVMYLRLGQVDTVVVSSPAAAQAVLRDHDLNFASRPRLLGPEVMCYGCLDVAFAPYGAYWRAMRKVAVVELLSARKVGQFAPIRDGETMSLVRELRAAAGEPVNLGGLLASCANSITATAAFGDRCRGGSKERFLEAMAVALSTSLGFCVSDLFPSLRLLDVVAGTRRRLRRAHRKLDQVLDEIIAECEARRKSAVQGGDGGGEEEEEELLSVMLRIRDEGGFDFPITTTNIKAIIVLLDFQDHLL